MLKKMVGKDAAAEDDDIDRNVEEEIAKNLWAHHRMLPPESKYKKRWNQFIVLLVIYNCWSIPIIIGFNLYGPRYYPENGVQGPNEGYPPGLYNYGLMTWDYIVDCFFLVDMLLTFRTTYFDEDNELVLDKKVIAKAYLKWAFWIDLVALVPWEIFGLFANGELYLQIKVLRLLRFYKHIRKLDVHNNALRVTEMLGIFIVYAHIVGSIWWSLGVSDFNRHPSGIPAGITWVERAKICVGPNRGEYYPPPSPPPAPPDGIVPRNNDDEYDNPYCISEDDDNLIQKYMSSMYWALTTLIKTPWVHPDTVPEKIFASIIVVTGAIFFAAILGNITAMINSFDKSNAQLRDVMTTLHRLIGKYDVPAKLQKRVFMYVQTQWSTTKGLDNQRILAKVPPALRGDILESIYSDLLQTCPLFKRVSIECVRVMLGKLHSEVCLAKETLLAPGQLCSELYLLVRGVLRVQPGEGDGKGGTGSMRKSKMLFRMIEKSGAPVGMRDPFEKDYRFPFHVVAVKQAQLLTFTAKDMMEVFAMDNRHDIEAICDVLEKEFEDINSALNKDTAAQRRPSAGAAQPGRRRSSVPTVSPTGNAVMTDHEEVHSRIGSIEETLRLCDTEIRSIQEHMTLLPQLCEMLNIPLTEPPAAASAPEA